MNKHYYLPCWEIENFEEEKAKKYCSHHSRLKDPNQLSLWQQFKQITLNKTNERTKYTNNESTRDCPQASR